MSTDLRPASAADLVDWDAASRLAREATPAGPTATAAARRNTVTRLRRGAADAPAWVGRITGLGAAARRAAASTEVLVVDRAGLVRAAATGLRDLMAGVPAAPSSPALRAVGAAEVAGALGLLSTRVLGQVLPPAAPSGAEDAGAARGGTRAAGGGAGSAGRAAQETGATQEVTGAAQAVAPSGGRVEPVVEARMLLVAPNVLALQQRLELDRLDLPVWVALHEATHVVQLSAAPWLAAHLRAGLTEVVEAIVATWGGSAGEGGARLGPAERVARALGLRDGEKGVEGLSQLLSASERRVLARLVTTLSFLEGHAEAVLDAVKPSQMPSVHRLRASLTGSGHQEGGTGPGIGALLWRLLGAQAKEAQYDDGAAFVRAVVARVGHEGLNRVWAAPELLPSPEEIARPEAWVERMGL